MSENEKKKIKFRLNVFDIIIILLVLAAAVIFIVTKTGILKSDTSTSVASTSGEITYKVELYDLPLSTAQKITAGDNLTDKVKKFEVGEVVSVEIVPYKKLSNDFINGKIIQAEVPDRYKAKVIIKATKTESDTAILIGGGFEARVGTKVSLLGPGYFGTGYITEMERGNEQ